MKLNQINHFCYDVYERSYLSWAMKFSFLAVIVKEFFTPLCFVLFPKFMLKIGGRICNCEYMVLIAKYCKSDDLDDDGMQFVVSLLILYLLLFLFILSINIVILAEKKLNQRIAVLIQATSISIALFLVLIFSKITESKEFSSPYIHYVCIAMLMAFAIPNKGLTHFYLKGKHS